MKILPLIVICIANVTACHAASVSWGAAIDTGIIDASGAALTTSNVVRIGYFGTLTNSQVQANALTPSGITALNSDWHQFAQSTIGTNTFAPGSFSESSSPLYSSLSGFTPSSQIYFWALKSSDPVNNPLTTVTQTAIGYVPFANLPSWRFPASDVSPGVSIDVSQLSNANSVFLAGSYVSASSPSLTSTFGSVNHAVQLANVSAVPEPSTFAIGLIAAFAAAGSRNRRSKKLPATI